MHRRLKNLVLIALLLTVPCFAFLLFCAGFLPVAAMAVLLVRFLSFRDPGVAILVVPLVIEAGVYVVILNKVAGYVARFIQRDLQRAPLFTALFFAVSLAMTLLPINAFDCMDGHSIRRCTGLRMYFGWLWRSDSTTGPYVEPSCGDFGW